MADWWLDQNRLAPISQDIKIEVSFKARTFSANLTYLTNCNAGVKQDDIHTLSVVMTTGGELITDNQDEQLFAVDHIESLVLHDIEIKVYTYDAANNWISAPLSTFNQKHVIHLQIVQEFFHNEQSLQSAVLDVPEVYQLRKDVGRPGQLYLGWEVINQAVGYEVEYHFIPGDPAKSQAVNQAIPVPFHNGSFHRFYVEGNHIFIPDAFPEGTLIYRVRAIGVDDANGWPVTSAWSQDIVNGQTDLVNWLKMRS